MSDNVKFVFVTINGQEVVRCTPDPVDVSGVNVLINFRIVTDGWVFPETGAVTVANGGSTFPYPSWTLGPQSAGLLDTGVEKGDFSYTLALNHVASGRRVTADPSIRNQD